MKLWAYVGMLALSQFPGSQVSLEPDGLDSTEKAWLVGRPQAVGHGADFFIWSSTGARVYFIKRTTDDKDFLNGPDVARANSKMQLWSYGTAQGDSRMVAEFPVGSEVQDIQWLPQADYGVLTIATPSQQGTRMSVQLINGPSGRVQEVFNSMNPLQAVPQPNSPTMVIFEQGDAPQFHLYSASGGVKQLPIQMGGKSVFVSMWIDQNTFTFHSAASPVSEDGGWMKANITTGQTAKLSEEEYRQMREFQYSRYMRGNDPEPELQVDQFRVKNGTKYESQWIIQAWPHGFNCQVVLSRDADYAALAPDSSYVALIEKGVVTVRKLTPVSRSQLLALLEQKERTELMNRAKQAGTALHIYSADYDDVFPPANADIIAALMPYVKDGSLLEQVVFYPPAGLISDLERIAETPMGHIDGKFGRAIIYADGHIAWVSNKGGK